MQWWRKWWVFPVVAGGIIGLDQISKAWVLENLPYGASLVPIPALDPLLRITHSSNTGAAFGLLPMAGGVFLLLSLLISSVLLFIYARADAQARLFQFGLSLVVGGALGNALDRLQHGHVVDFVHLTLPGVISNVSNFADHAIVIGVALLILDNWQRERRAKAALSGSGDQLLLEDRPQHEASNHPQ